MDWNKMVKMTVPVGLCGWQQRGSLTINGRTTEFPVGMETELPEPVAERVKALMADAEEKAEHVQPLKPWMQYVTGADGVARWEDRLAYAETEEAVIVPEMALFPAEDSMASFRLAEPLTTSLRLGMICTVTYNGVEYECPVKTMNLEGFEVMSLGNTGSSDEPFAFTQMPPEFVQELGFYAQLDSYDGAESVTLSIMGEVGEVKTIDPDKMGKNAGANKVLATDENGEAVWSDSLPGGAGGGGGVIYIATEIEAPYTSVTAYTDETCTVPITYEQGKAIMDKSFVLSYRMPDGSTKKHTPLLIHMMDENKQAMCQTAIMDESMQVAYAIVDMSFADT